MTSSISLITSRITLPCWAPRAMRIPISRVRRATTKASTPCRPTTARRRRQQREADGKEREHPLVGESHVELIVQRAQVRDHQVRIDAAYLLAQLGHHLARIAVDARIHVNAVDSAHAAQSIATNVWRGMFPRTSSYLAFAEDADDLGIGRLASRPDLCSVRPDCGLREYSLTRASLTRHRSPGAAPVVPAQIAPRR